MDIRKLKAFLDAAQISYTEANGSLQLVRAGCRAVITPGIYYYGANFAIQTSSGRLSFNSSADPARIIAGLDFLLRVQQCLPRLIWARKQLVLIAGVYPGMPVLAFNPDREAAEIIPRPPSFNQLHKFAAIRTFPLATAPQTVAQCLDQLCVENTPRQTWKSVVDDWNRKHGAQFGHELSLGASYIYAWGGIRFLLDGSDLCLDVWQPVSSCAFPETIRLLESLQAMLQGTGRNESFQKIVPNKQA